MKKNYELIDKNAVCVGQGIIGLSCTLIGVTTYKSANFFAN